MVDSSLLKEMKQPLKQSTRIRWSVKRYHDLDGLDEQQISTGWAPENKTSITYKNACFNNNDISVTWWMWRLWFTSSLTLILDISVMTISFSRP